MSKMPNSLSLLVGLGFFYIKEECRRLISAGRSNLEVC